MEQLEKVRDDLTSTVESFSKLKEQIETISAQTGKDFKEAFAQVDATFDQLNGVALKIEENMNQQKKQLVTAAKLQLQQQITIATNSMDRADRNMDGMDKKEWVRFTYMLPKIVVKMFAEYLKSEGELPPDTKTHHVDVKDIADQIFDLCDENDSGTVTFEELHDVLDKLYDINEKALLDELERQKTLVENSGGGQISRLDEDDGPNEA